MSNPPRIVLLGKIGHGKTRILNAVCGTNFSSLSCSESCTENRQSGQSLIHGINMVDTPGFYSTEKASGHLQQQINALEASPISGIYIVIKYGRADELAETLNRIMDFIGDNDDDVRIIVTFSEIADDHFRSETKTRLSQLLGIDEFNIAMFGRYSKAAEIETFIHSTLHDPRVYNVSKEQEAYMSTVGVGIRKFNGVFEEIHDTVNAASKECQYLSRRYSNLPTAGTAIAAVRAATVSASEKAKETITQQSKDLTAEERTQLSSKLNGVNDQIDELLASTAKNIRRKVDSSNSKLQATFLKREGPWTIQYTLDGEPTQRSDIDHKISRKLRKKRSWSQFRWSKRSKIVRGNEFPSAYTPLLAGTDEEGSNQTCGEALNVAHTLEIPAGGFEERIANRENPDAVEEDGHGNDQSMEEEVPIRVFERTEMESMEEGTSRSQAPVRATADGRNNSQHFWVSTEIVPTLTAFVGSICLFVLEFVRCHTDNS